MPLRRSREVSSRYAYLAAGGKVQAYCAEQQHRCRECAFWDDEKIECKFYRSYPAAWNLDGDDGADADTNGKGV